MTNVQSSLDESILIDTVAAVVELVDGLADLPTNPPSLYIDLEGVNLSRFGTISILQILVLPTKTTYLLDIHTLGALAICTSGKTGKTLKSVLESAKIPKVIFDVRRDSDALHAHFAIKVDGVHDLQLMELSTRPAYRKRHVSGLAKCVEMDIGLSEADKKMWKEIKERGRNLFAPQRGGSYEVFNTRTALTRYCQVVLYT
ncbi:hypothetical protein HYALB_00002593 [Hymenoscyphus albidus]|uniref:3'-5' exonuclease domain-containing protein n=1 Tax=Hymenoscyphus albidus TaxID=595503 RepID=A0A9N9LSF7_9HELO|nr:hypothetical protein HYALB_00002593 [Hymenoscyphus albidus]